MRAMVLRAPRLPLEEAVLPRPEPGPGEVLIRVEACAVCRTDLHVIDGELRNPKLPLILGHEIVGVVEMLGLGCAGVHLGMRVGIPWLGSTCGQCRYCRTEHENLCDRARFTGYLVDGGYAEYALADHRFATAIPDAYSSVHAAPLLCAGLIGYRSLRMVGDAERVGFFGFGAAAHILTQVARYNRQKVYAFTRPQDRNAQAFALELGAVWAGASDEAPPEELDAAILFAPVGGLVPLALRAVRKAGVVVCAGIHMSDIPKFPYELLWGERVLRSVANLTRRDGEEFFAIAPLVPVRTEIEVFPLSAANEALGRLRAGELRGAAVLAPE